MTKRALSKLITVRLVNPVVLALDRRNLLPRSTALLETTGRRSGEPRRVPVGDGLRGDTFWIVTEHGRGADYVKNIERDARVRVKVGSEWRAGTARIMAADDPRARLRWLRRPLNDAVLRLNATELLTIRVDLDT